MEVFVKEQMGATQPDHVLQAGPAPMERSHLPCPAYSRTGLWPLEDRRPELQHNPARFGGVSS